MSEEKKTETKVEDKKPDAIDESVAMMRSKIIMLEKIVADKDELVKDLTEKLDKANEFIEGDQKKMLLAEIRPLVDIPDEILELKTMDQLKDIKKTLDVVRIPAFKSGTPVSYDKKPSARQQLDNMFDESMAKLKGGKPL